MAHGDMGYQGPQRRREDVRLSILEVNLANLIETNDKHHMQLDDDIVSLRNQTHDWMQKMLNRLPPWAVFTISSGAGAIGAMAMWIITHAGK